MRVVKDWHLWVELRISPQDMIQNTEVRVAEFLRGVHKIAHDRKVRADFDGRKAHTNAHRFAPLFLARYFRGSQLAWRPHGGYLHTAKEHPTVRQLLQKGLCPMTSCQH